MPAPKAKEAEAKPEQKAKPEPPKLIAPIVRLEAPYAYYDEDGSFKHWGQGQIVSDAAEILHLQERGARLVPHKDSK